MIINIGDWGLGPIPNPHININFDNKKIKMIFNNYIYIINNFK